MMAPFFLRRSFRRSLSIRQFLISPSIDPLSDKNRELPQETVDAVLTKYGIEKNKPIITQISRFDRLKDPVGVIEAFKLVRKYNDCQLILAGGSAIDDPEGLQVLEEVREKAGKDPDIHILLMPQNDIEVNALTDCINSYCAEIAERRIRPYSFRGFVEGKTRCCFECRRHSASD